VRECEIYLGLFGRTYGNPDDEGHSATEQEFDYATELGKDRIVFIRTLSPRVRQARKMAELIAKARLEVTYDTFGSLEELKRKVMQSLLYWQQDQNRRP
jgi:ATP-dependent DNA helicase RecG